MNEVKFSLEKAMREVLKERGDPEPPAAIEPAPHPMARRINEYIIYKDEEFDFRYTQGNNGGSSTEVLAIDRIVELTQCIVTTGVGFRKRYMESSEKIDAVCIEPPSNQLTPKGKVQVEQIKRLQRTVDPIIGKYGKNEGEYIAHEVLKDFVRDFLDLFPEAKKEFLPVS